MHRQRILKECVAVSKRELFFVIEKKLTDPKLKIGNPSLLDINTKDVEITETKFKTEEHNFLNILKSPQVDGKFYKKKYKSINRKEVFMIASEFLIGTVGLTVDTC